MSLQKNELIAMLRENKHLRGKRIEIILLNSKTAPAWLFTINGEIRNIVHFLSPEEMTLLNNIEISKKSKNPFVTAAP